MIRLSGICMIFAFLLSACSENSSQSSLKQAECESSDYCLVFLSATTVEGDIDDTGDNDGNGIEEADALCNADVNKPNGSSYKAIIVDGVNRTACTTASCSGGSSEHTDWVLQPDTVYRRGDGTTVIGTTDANGLLSFPLNNSISALVNSVWTGLNANWTTAANNCASWTSRAGSGQSGLDTETNTDAISEATTVCSFNSGLIYCAEQPSLD